MIVPSRPTAHPSLADIISTDLRTELVGLVTAFQLDPSQWSIMPSDPTAHPSVAAIAGLMDGGVNSSRSKGIKKRVRLFKVVILCFFIVFIQD
jgi:hypothetical protein